MPCGQSVGPTKKTSVARERDTERVQARRNEFLEKQGSLDVSRLVFVDESGFRLGSGTRYGWSPKGLDAPGREPGGWDTMTMIGGLSLDGFRAFTSIDAATSAEVFAAFVEVELAPNLKPGDIVVLDNLSAHKNAAALAAIRKVGAEVLFLPPYSPEFNPIERAWSKLKEYIRRLQTLTRDAFEKAVAAAMDAISLEDIMAWTNHAGYAVSQR